MFIANYLCPNLHTFQEMKWQIPTAVISINEHKRGEYH